MRVNMFEGNVYVYDPNKNDFSFIRPWSCMKDEAFTLVYWSNDTLGFNIWTNLVPTYDGLFVPNLQLGIVRAKKHYSSRRSQLYKSIMPQQEQMNRLSRIYNNLLELESDININF